jgi:hypothetical protein
MTTDQITHALSRHVQYMQRGFAIQTNCGGLWVPPGPLADAITHLVRKHYETSLAKLALEQA